MTWVLSVQVLMVRAIEKTIWIWTSYLRSPTVFKMQKKFVGRMRHFGPPRTPGSSEFCHWFAGLPVVCWVLSGLAKWPKTISSDLQSLPDKMISWAANEKTRPDYNWWQTISCKIGSIVLKFYELCQKHTYENPKAVHRAPQKIVHRYLSKKMFVLNFWGLTRVIMIIFICWWLFLRQKKRFD